MNDDGGLLEKVGHHQRVALRALAQLHPVAASLVELWTSYVPTRRERRQTEFLELLVERIEPVIETVDTSRILNEPLADVLEDVMAAVATRKGLDKREYYAEILVNALTGKAPEWDRQERMLACLEDLRPSHLRLLAMTIRDLLTDGPPSGSVVGRRMGVNLPIDDDEDFDLIDRDWRDMARWGIFKEPDTGGVGPGPHWGAVEYLGGAAVFMAILTPFGLEFAEYVGAAKIG